MKWFNYAMIGAIVAALINLIVGQMNFPTTMLFIGVLLSLITLNISKEPRC